MRVIRNLKTTISICIVAAAGLAGCATTARNIDSGAELALASAAADTVVFGKFRLIRDGREAKLGEGIFANTATLHLYQAGGHREIVGKVGSDGEFAWVLSPGNYRVANIGFNNRGDRVEPETSFAFTVADGHDAIYVGTMTLEASFDSGYLGLNGTVDRYTVSDDCETDCESRLARLGLSGEAVTVALFQQQGQLASTN